MQILHSMKDFKKIIPTIIQTEDYWIRVSLDIMDKPMKGCQEDGKYTRLTDGSYGQFALSRNNDVLVCSVGRITAWENDDDILYANDINAYSIDEFGIWKPIGNFVVGDCYPENKAFREDIARKVSAETRMCMKQFASIIDSKEKVKNLMKSFEEKYEV